MHKLNEGQWLLLFYAPWCTHCKKLQPVFESVAEHYHRQNGPVRVGRVDAVIHKGLTARYPVEGYPTVVLLNDGALTAKYKGPRTFAAITSFVDNPHAPATPREGGPSGQRRRQRFLRWVEAASSWFAELDSLQAGVLMMLTTGSALVCGLVCLICTTTASTRR